MGRLMDCQFVVTNMGTLTLPTDHVRPMGDTAQERAQRAAGLTGRSPQCLVTGFLLIDHCTVVPRSTDVEIVCAAHILLSAR